VNFLKVFLFLEHGYFARMMVRRLKRKRLSRTVPPNPLLARPNQEWAMDFMSDALATGRALRTFNLIDSYTKE
jgi:putative transposase